MPKRVAAATSRGTRRLPFIRPDAFENVGAYPLDEFSSFRILRSEFAGLVDDVFRLGELLDIVQMRGSQQRWRDDRQGSFVDWNNKVTCDGQ